MSEIAVVVPTFQRAALLRQTLDGLLRQTLNTDRFEVVVTDDGPHDGTVDVARSFSRQLNLQYVYHHDLGHRVAATRNAGARAATAPVLVFVDAGTRPSAGCIEAHLRAHKTAECTGSPTVVVGRVAGYDTRVASDDVGDFASLLICDTQDVLPHVSDMRDDELDAMKERSLPLPGGCWKLQSIRLHQEKGRPQWRQRMTAGRSWVWICTGAGRCSCG